MQSGGRAERGPGTGDHARRPTSGTAGYPDVLQPPRARSRGHVDDTACFEPNKLSGMEMRLKKFPPEKPRREDDSNYLKEVWSSI